MKRITISVLVSFIVFAAVILSACHVDMETFVNTDSVTDSNNTQYISGILPRKSLDDLFEQSSLAVIGTVTDKEGIQISHQEYPDYVQNFTDYYVSISEVIRGATDDNDIVLRIEGGTAGGITQIFDPTAKLEIGKEYLFFLYQPGMGGAFNTEGSYYYILGLPQGVFSSDDPEHYTSQAGETLEMAELISRANEKPVDKDYFRNEFINNQIGNLETGFISAERYNALMNSINGYAKIIFIDDN